MSTRRRFIKQTAVTAAGMAVGATVFGKSRTNANAKVIIIGAGFSGLAAAYRLHQENIDFVILESRNRIGGRVFSHPITDDLVIELGGEWVGDSHSRIQELCKELNLELENNQFDTHLIYKGMYAQAGKWDYSEAWKTKYQTILEKYPFMTETQQLALDQTDWWRFLIQNGCDERDLTIRELLDSTDFGESNRHVSAFAALSEYAESSPKNEMDRKIKGGNAMLAHRITERIGKEKILLKHNVTKIEQTNKVKVWCENGKLFEADYIICSIPTFSISKINWQPALPPEKMEALSELQYARINKHAFVFDERFWTDESFDMITDELPHYFYHGTKNQKSKKGVLISYSIGDKSAVIANQSDERNAQMIFQTLEPHFGKIQHLLHKQANYYWGEDALSKGAYAIYGKGQWFTLRPILQKPFLKTHFAGEHLADWQGFMEGAINSGEAAAEEILN